MLNLCVPSSACPVLRNGTPQIPQELKESFENVRHTEARYSKQKIWLRYFIFHSSSTTIIVLLYPM